MGGGGVVARLSLVVVALWIAGYIVGPPLYWHLIDHSSLACFPCHCDCSSYPTISIPQGLNNFSIADCGKHNPELNGETEKNFVELLSDELKLLETEALKNQQHAEMVVLESKKSASQFQKEANKCSSGMETCEEARDKAEIALVAQKKLTTLWELRAGRKGWK